MRNAIAILAAAGLLGIAPPAPGHDLWLNVSNHYPQVGETVEIVIGFGHKFPVDEDIKDEMLKQVVVETPWGKPMPLKKGENGRYRLAIEKEGKYLITAESNSGFFTKTTQGYEMRNKKGLANAILCVNYKMLAKALVIASGKEGNVSRHSEPLLEIVPRRSMKGLKKGDEMPVKVLYRGKPLAKIMVHATYAGFSEKMSTFAFSSPTNEDGEATVKLTHEGDWMIKLNHKLPYTDGEECDEYWYKASFTFHVKS